MQGPRRYIKLMFYDIPTRDIHRYQCDNPIMQCYIFSDISAYPDSVNVLDKIHGDVRTPDKLIDGINDTLDGGHMWLAPILPSIVS